MWMKAALAGSLAYRLGLLVLDEPFSGLDPLVREDSMHGILERAGKSTMLISTHDLADIETIASHVAYLENGRSRRYGLLSRRHSGCGTPQWCSC